MVNANGLDLCDVTGGGSRSDKLGSPALRASEQPLERCDKRAFCDTHTVTKFARESKCFRGTGRPARQTRGRAPARPALQASSSALERPGSALRQFDLVLG